MTVDLAQIDRGQVADVVDCLRAVLGEALVGAYLHGSAVLGGLRPGSDLDVLAVNARPTTDAEKDDLVDRLLAISGSGPAQAQPRPVELTVVVGPQVRPWRYPPPRDFQYGEWWRDRFERRDPELRRPKEDPDLAILVSMTLLADTPVTGPSASDVFDPVPRSDFMDAVLAGLPEMMQDPDDEDTRNVALTLARIWNSVATGGIRSKDEAADWALMRLAPEHRAVLERHATSTSGSARRIGRTWSRPSRASRRPSRLTFGPRPRARSPRTIAPCRRLLAHAGRRAPGSTQGYSSKIVQADGHEPVRRAVILAGGKAQRLRPLTDDRPKAMVEIAGRPIIEHQLRWLAENGLRDILISLGHQAEVLQEHVGDGSRLGVQVDYAVEPEPLGRGGGLRFAAARLADGQTFVAVNGDVICRFPLRDMIKFHERLGVFATVALAPYRSRWGVVDIDGDLITGFTQSPKLPYWINAGVYVLEPDIVARLPERGDHEDTTFPELANEGRLAGFRIDGYWRGIDTLKDVAEATSELKRLPGTPSQNRGQHQSVAALDIRSLRKADAAALSAAFAAITWTKPAEQFVRYASDADTGTRTSWVATVNGEMAGYVTLLWDSDYPGIAGTGVPEIMDLNVLPQFRRRGIASALLDRSEGEAARRSAVVAIGVGLHPGYNAAQVLYVKRGYIPDGLGVTYGDRFVQEGESLPFDDSLALHFTKKLADWVAS